MKMFILPSLILTLTLSAHAMKFENTDSVSDMENSYKRLKQSYIDAQKVCGDVAQFKKEADAELNALEDNSIYVDPIKARKSLSFVPMVYEVLSMPFSEANKLGISKDCHLTTIKKVLKFLKNGKHSDVTYNFERMLRVAKVERHNYIGGIEGESYNDGGLVRTLVPTLFVLVKEEARDGRFIVGRKPDWKMYFEKIDMLVTEFKLSPLGYTSTVISDIPDGNTLTYKELIMAPHEGEKRGASNRTSWGMDGLCNHTDSIRENLREPWFGETIDTAIPQEVCSVLSPLAYTDLKDPTAKEKFESFADFTKKYQADLSDSYGQLSQIRAFSECESNITQNDFCIDVAKQFPFKLAISLVKLTRAMASHSDWIDGFDFSRRMPDPLFYYGRTLSLDNVTYVRRGFPTENSPYSRKTALLAGSENLK